jgi:hypothetical protein
MKSDPHLSRNSGKEPSLKKKKRVHPEIVDFGSGQGRREFETGSVARCVENFKFARTPVYAKKCCL